MKINFTKKEYRTLLEMLNMADWVANAHRGEEDNPRIEKYDQLYSNICSHFKTMGCDDLIYYDKASDSYGYSAEGEGKCESFKRIDEFEEQAFWDQLTDRLVSRDMNKKFSRSDWKKMTDLQRLEARFEAEKIWTEELEKNGLDNLHV